MDIILDTFFEIINKALLHSKISSPQKIVSIRPLLKGKRPSTAAQNFTLLVILASYKNSEKQYSTESFIILNLQIYCHYTKLLNITDNIPPQ